jgi:hypothetical protein
MSFWTIKMRLWIVLLSGALIPALCVDAIGVQEWVVGNEANPWGTAATLEAIDRMARPGWIRPEQIHPDENLALGAKTRGGGISSPQPTMMFQEKKEYEDSEGKNLMEGMIDGDGETVFEMDEESARGTVGGFVVLDLGEIIPGVYRIRFYPRAAFEDRFMRAYEISVNDGSPENITEEGVLLWQRVVREDKNDLSTVEVEISPQYVRYIKLQSNTSLRWEIAELEVYGEGFAPEATYISEIIDLVGEEGLANFGKIRWSARIDPHAQMELRTRSGKTPDPFKYYKLVVELGDSIEISLPEPGESGTAKEQYEKLSKAGNPVRKRFDTEHWSFWSVPYSTSESDVVSPSPRRYFQFKIELFSELYSDRVELDSLSFDYSSPVMAHEIVAEIFPRTVPAGEVVTFTYSLRPTIEGNDTGFDVLEVSAPMEINLSTVGDLVIGGSPVEDEKFLVESLGGGQKGFTLRFPKIRTSEDSLTFVFDGRVLVYGTRFRTKVFDSERPEELPQYPDPELSHLSVGVSLGETLVASAGSSPNPFTPNGDGANDHTLISYQILKLLEPAPVSITIYDLNGAPVRKISKSQINGIYEERWDGKDDAGKFVPPGIYVYRILVEAEARKDAKVGKVAVVY